jgi:hypothetical protein
MARQPIPGLTPEAERAVGAYLAQLEARIAALEGEPAGFEVKRSNFTARAGQVVTVEPPPEGLTVTLPAASATTRRARVVVTSKNANPVRWEATRGLVNGTRQVTSNSPGAAEAICDGEAWHVSIGAATPTGSAASTLGNAKFLLEEADSGLPNARVADDSTEVDLDYTSAGIVSWFLKTASVGFAKLANLTGLSVLGRAANSSGVMAAITASGARQALMSNSAGTAIGWRSIEAADVPAHTLAEVLAAGNSSGANDVQVDVGQKINLGAPGPTTSNPQITCGDTTLRIRGAGNTFLIADGTAGVAALATTGSSSVAIVQAQGTGSIAALSSAGSAQIDTGGVGRLNISSSGEWVTPSGSSGQVLTHQGAGTPPVWATVDLSSVTYTAGDGIDLTGLQFSADVSDFAGTGLEDDGSNNLRIAAAAAGDGLTGGGGSALAVGAGDGIDVGADSVSVDVTDIIGATDTAISEDASNNLEYIGSPSIINTSSTSGDLNVVDISNLKCGGVVSFQSVTEATIDGFTAKPNGFWFVLHNRDDTTSDSITLLENSGNTTTSMRTPDARGWRLTKNCSVMLIYSNSRWRVVAARDKQYITPVNSVTWGSDVDNYQRVNTETGGTEAYNVHGIRVDLSADVTLSGVEPDPAEGNGEVLTIINIDSVFRLTISHEDTGSTAANRFFLPATRSLVIGPRSSAQFRYDGISSRWRLLSGPYQLGLLKRDEITTATSWSSTAPTGATMVRLQIGGAGGGGGGADAESAQEVCAGGGGGSGATVDIIIATIDDTTSITGTTGSGGTSGANTGGNGGNGGDSTATYNGVTYTAGGGGGGTGTAAGADGTNNVKATAGGTAGTTTEAQASRNGAIGAPGLMFRITAAIANCMAIGGRGAASAMHGGGEGGIAANAETSSGGNSGVMGSGGGGAARSKNATAGAVGATGGTGGHGWTIVEWYGTGTNTLI